eukprot:6463068-Amphidinium_carterae.1
MGTTQVPIGIAGKEILVPFKVIKDAGIPPLLPSSLCKTLQAKISYPDRSVQWQTLGPQVTSELHILPSGHIAVAITDFENVNNTATRSDEGQVQAWRRKQYEKATGIWVEAKKTEPFEESEQQKCAKLMTKMPIERVAVLSRTQWEQLLEARLPVAHGRTNLVQDGKAARSLTLGACTSRGPRMTSATKEETQLLHLAHQLAQERPEGFRIPYLACTYNASALPLHRDQNSSISCVLTAAEQRESSLHIGSHVSSPGRWLLFDATCAHEVPQFRGVRVSIVYYTPRYPEKLEPYLADLACFGFPVADWVKWTASSHPAVCRQARLLTCSQPLVTTLPKQEQKGDELSEQSQQTEARMGSGRPSTRACHTWVAMGAVAMGSLMVQNAADRTQCCHNRCAACQSTMSPGDVVLASQEQQLDSTSGRSRETSDWRRSGDYHLDRVTVSEKSDNAAIGMRTPSGGHETPRKWATSMVAVHQLPQSMEEDSIRAATGRVSGLHSCAGNASGQDLSECNARPPGLCSLGSQTNVDSNRHASKSQSLRSVVRDADAARHNRAAGEEGDTERKSSIITEGTSSIITGDQNRCAAADRWSGGHCTPELGQAGDGVRQRRGRGRANDHEHRHEVSIYWQGQQQKDFRLCEWTEKQLDTYSEWGEMRTTPRGVRKHLASQAKEQETVQMYPEWQENIVEDDTADVEAEELASKTWEPSDRQLRDLQIAHNNMGHPTPPKMAQMLTNAGAHRTLVKYVRETWRCPTCRRRAKPDAPRPAALAKSFEVNQVVGVDLMEVESPLNPSEKLLLLNVVDWGSHYQQVVQIRSKHASAVWRGFSEAWLRILGPPTMVVCDQGTEFQQEFGSSVSSSGTLLVSVNTRTPWEAGKTEKAGGLWKDLFRIVVEQESPVDEDELQALIALVTSQRNSNMNRAGFSPHQRVFGISKRTPTSLMSGDNFDPALTRGSHADAFHRAEHLRQVVAR